MAIISENGLAPFQYCSATVFPIWWRLIAILRCLHGASFPRILEDLEASESNEVIIRTILIKISILEPPSYDLLYKKLSHGVTGLKRSLKSLCLTEVIKEGSWAGSGEEPVSAPRADRVPNPHGKLPTSEMVLRSEAFTKCLMTLQKVLDRTSLSPSDLSACRCFPWRDGL